MSISATSNEASVRFLSELFSPTPPSNVAVRFCDGTCWPDDRPRAATLVLNHPGSLHAMFRSGTEIGLAEAYLSDDFDVEGDMEAACEIADVLADGVGWAKSISLALLRRGLAHRKAQGHEFSTSGRPHSLERDRRAIAFHYDVSNDFYRLWLDRQMVYSCAYFEDPSLGIDEAQSAKLDYICRKLRLRPGQRLLDIGCGWGALALHAARHYGATVLGVTLSANQASYARMRVVAEGFGEQVKIELKDYRELDHKPGFDAIVSVGMEEHVGRENLPAYFGTALDLLSPGGVFLNHAIGEGSRFHPGKGSSFIAEHVFPDSDIPPIRTVIAAAETAGFEVRDAENLREHYAMTLRHWVRRLESRHDEAIGIVDEGTFRIWRLYMAASAHGFKHGKLAIYQTLLSKPGFSGEACLPLTRSDWYSKRGEPAPHPSHAFALSHNAGMWAAR